jgi:hypothetical protein
MKSIHAAPHGAALSCLASDAIGTITLNEGTASFSDTASSSFEARYYRLRVP